MQQAHTDRGGLMPLARRLGRLCREAGRNLYLWLSRQRARLRPRPGRVSRLRDRDRGDLFLHFATLPGPDREARFHGRQRYPALLAHCRDIDFAEAILLGRHAGMRLIAVAELMPTRLEGQAAFELAISVSADWQHRGIALALVRSALTQARAMSPPRPVMLFTRAQNRSMLRICHRLGGRGELADGEYRFVFDPQPETPATLPGAQD